MKANIKKFIPTFFIGLIVINVFVWSEYFKPVDKNLHFYMLDVGQGDALFFRTPYEQDVLIDGGPGKAVLGELGKAMPFYDRHIDMVILTHPHKDHVEGLVGVLSRYEVGRVLLTGTVFDSGDYEEFLELIKEKEIPVTIARKGQQINFSKDLKFDVLAPGDLKGKKLDNPNNSSIIGVLDFNDFEVLLPGDAEVEEWRDILQDKGQKVEILKAAHHGSENGTSKEVLKKFSPETVLISAGENNMYGHPHEKVMNLLKKFEVEVYRTDTQGTIHIVSDGESYTVK